MPCTCDHLRSLLSFCYSFAILWIAQHPVESQNPRYLTAVTDCQNFCNKFLLVCIQQRKHLLRGAGRDRGDRIIKELKNKRVMFEPEREKNILTATSLEWNPVLFSAFYKLKWHWAEDKTVGWDKCRAVIKRPHTLTLIPLISNNSKICCASIFLYCLILQCISPHHSICSHCQQSLKCQIKCNEDNGGAWQIFQTSFRI